MIPRIGTQASQPGGKHLYFLSQFTWSLSWFVVTAGTWSHIVQVGLQLPKRQLPQPWSSEAGAFTLNLWQLDSQRQHLEINSYTAQVRQSEPKSQSRGTVAWDPNSSLGSLPAPEERAKGWFAMQRLRVYRVRSGSPQRLGWRACASCWMLGAGCGCGVPSAPPPGCREAGRRQSHAAPLLPATLLPPAAALCFPSLSAF